MRGIRPLYVREENVESVIEILRAGIEVFDGDLDPEVVAGLEMWCEDEEARLADPPNEYEADLPELGNGEEEESEGDEEPEPEAEEQEAESTAQARTGTILRTKPTLE